MPRITLAIALSACLVAAATTALAQGYPSRPIRVVVPFTPGTGMDIIARNVGPKLSERLGQPVVIDNRPGASGNLGAELVAKSAPDGHTMMISGNPLIVSAHLYRNVPFKPLADFSPISLAAWGTLMLVANPGTKINSVADLIAQAKANPGKISYGSPGIGTPHHMSMELLKQTAGVYLTHIPYRGTAPAVTDLLGGQVDAMFLPIHVALPHVKSGKLVALGIGSDKRHPLLPDLPTLKEARAGDVNVDMWFGIFAPPGTPADQVQRLNRELRDILATPEVRTAFQSQGMDPASSSPEEFSRLVTRDADRWAGLIRTANIRAE